MNTIFVCGFCLKTHTLPRPSTTGSYKTWLLSLFALANRTESMCTLARRRICSHSKIRSWISWVCPRVSPQLPSIEPMDHSLGIFMRWGHQDNLDRKRGLGVWPTVQTSKTLHSLQPRFRSRDQSCPSQKVQCKCRLKFHSPTHSLNHSLTHSLTLSLTHPLTHRLT